MLRAMGIDVWFERPAADAFARREVPAGGEPEREPEEASPARSARDAVAPVHTPERPPVPPRGSRPRADRTPAGSSGRSHGESPAPAPDQPALPELPPAYAPFALLCFKSPGVMLISRAPVPRKRQRLGHDIVEALEMLAGAGPVKCQTVDFAYPPTTRGAVPMRGDEAGAGRDTTPTPPDRVLRAFFGRQLSGMVSPRILICADALPHFEGWFDQPHQVIPSFDELFGDAARKRSLWRDLFDG